MVASGGEVMYVEFDPPYLLPNSSLIGVRSIHKNKPRLIHSRTHR